MTHPAYDKPIVYTPVIQPDGTHKRAPFGWSRMYKHTGFMRLNEDGSYMRIPAGEFDLGWPVPIGWIDQEQAMHDHLWAIAKTKKDIYEADNMFRRDVALSPTFPVWFRGGFAWFLYALIRTGVNLRDLYHGIRNKLGL